MKILTLKKTRFLFLSSVLALSVSVSYAQKSIYDVVPGSGPKKTSPDKRRETSVPGVINGHGDHRDNRTVYHHRRRKHLPPGQAKKIYGGEAKDYAPGQMKKHRHDDDEHHGDHHKGKRKHD